MPQAKREEQPLWVMATSVLAGSAIAVGICFLALALTAWLIASGRLGPEWLSRSPLAGAFLGVLAGGGYAVRCTRRRALVMGLAVGGGFSLLCLLAGAAEPGGPAPSAVLAALVAGGLAGVLFSGGTRRRK